MSLEVSSQPGGAGGTERVDDTGTADGTDTVDDSGTADDTGTADDAEGHSTDHGTPPKNSSGFTYCPCTRAPRCTHGVTQCPGSTVPIT